MQFQDFLKSKKACREAVKWVGDRTLEEAWNECERGDWMLWLAAKAPVERKLVTLAACDCAQTAWKYCEGKTLAAVKHCDYITREWCEGRVAIDRVQAARYDVYTAFSSDSVASTHAATATAAATTENVVYAATDAIYAAIYAASYTASAEAVAANASIYDTTAIAADAANAARKAASLECCRIVRNRIPLALIIAAIQEPVATTQEEK